MKICIVAGARPNFIKVAPIIRAIKSAQTEGKEIDFNLVYTGKSTDITLEKSLFQDLDIDAPNIFLNVDCESMNELTGKVMAEFENYLNNNQTDVVIVVDDLASTLAVSIVTKKRGLTLAHLVAGTRSFDINMPKEINRLVIDGLSDLLFVASAGATSIATKEGAENSRIYMVGNILIDTLRANRNKLIKPQILTEKNIKEHDYLVLTINRKALLADTNNLKNIIEKLLKEAKDKTIIAPLREGASNAIMHILKEIPHNLHIISSLSYLEFGYLTAHAAGIITDSGNIAEEATFNGIPCITLNNHTEHLETVSIGTNVLVGEDAQKLGVAIKELISGEWKKAAIPDRWDGRSAERIVQILLNQ